MWAVSDVWWDGSGTWEALSVETPKGENNWFPSNWDALGGYHSLGSLYFLSTMACPQPSSWISLSGQTMDYQDAAVLLLFSVWVWSIQNECVSHTKWPGGLQIGLWIWDSHFKSLSNSNIYSIFPFINCKIFFFAFRKGSARPCAI